MSTDCLITFDHPNGVYNSGDTLNGYVRLQTQKSKSIRAICIKIIGYGKASWSETRNKSATNFSAHEKFLNSVNYVLGSPDGESFDLDPGIHEYAFICHLPIQLPMSMQEDYGKIKYKVIVTIERRLRFDNDFKKDFVVNPTVDLNEMEFNRNLREISASVQTALLCRLCCCGNGEIKIELKVPCDGFIPGQQIPFQFIVYNDSNNDIPGAKVKLIKCFTYKSTEPYVKSKDREQEIIIKRFDNIPRYANREFKDNFVVPNMPPTFHTKFIKLNYMLRAKVYGYWMKKTYIDVPITIGTIPIVNSNLNNVNAFNTDDDAASSMKSTAVFLV